MLKPIFLILAISVISITNTKITSKPYELENSEELFSNFIIKHNKTYSSDEKEKRFLIFKENLKEINELNENSKTASFDINQFADLTKEEFLAQFTGFRPSDIEDDVCVPFTIRSRTAPDEFDWRTQNVVTPAKNQQGCGSCWAFSATGAVESQYAIHYKQQVDLSEQQLIDCDTGSNGCGGGFPVSALSLLVNSGGQISETDYPYQAIQSSCSFDASKVLVKLSRCFSEKIQDEEALKDILVNHGPLSFGLDADSAKHYSTGILENCQTTTVNHAVLLVGYGTENGSPYWIVKNSWGAEWGEGGFFRIHRGVNACGMMNFGFFGATVA